MRRASAFLALLAGLVGLASAQNAPSFPFCQCVRSTSTSRYEVVDTPAVSLKPGYWCVQLKVKETCDKPKSPCCQADLYKIELLAQAGCVGSRMTASYGYSASSLVEVPSVPTWETPDAAPEGAAVLKLVRLGLNVSSADGIYICYKALSGSCRKAEQVCLPGPDGRCQLSLFSSDSSCW
ncbi:hypothetical protein HYH02_004147 [Chlamydomonas schloesseri]|uniref:Pherophorin domain-containing protein n=1 Tax=Chlamydomonas schloesseri TaxID=2026947 RepID=A0A835WQH1_9CHLO|nr:hypothetical protein HYH02_004147 [Chlamydomonas schloesseri]|eukprot:KAG2451549.1 hypothetical protein HYH02_004147 [Chlamydomonas schloesseri]